MRQSLAAVVVMLVLAGSLSGCGRLRTQETAVTPPPAVSTPEADTGLDAAFNDLDTVEDAVDQVDNDAASGEQSENTTDAP